MTTLQLVITYVMLGWTFTTCIILYNRVSKVEYKTDQANYGAVSHRHLLVMLDKWFSLHEETHHSGDKHTMNVKTPTWMTPDVAQEIIDKHVKQMCGIGQITNKEE